MNKLVIVVAAVCSLSSFAYSAEESGQYCEANPSACAVDRTQGAPNQIKVEQIDWDKAPVYKHGGQPPKNAK